MFGVSNLLFVVHGWLIVNVVCRARCVVSCLMCVVRSWLGVVVCVLFAAKCSLCVAR